MEIKKDLLYTKEHEWIKVEGNEASIGITDFAQHALGDIVFVDLPEIDDELSKEEPFGAVESVKAASDIYMPIDGIIKEVNEEVVDDPSLVNNDAFENWLVKIEVVNKEQLEELLNASDYENICAEEE